MDKSKKYLIVWAVIATALLILILLLPGKKSQEKDYKPEFDAIKTTIENIKKDMKEKLNKDKEFDKKLSTISGKTEEIKEILDKSIKHVVQPEAVTSKDCPKRYGQLFEAFENCMNLTKSYEVEIPIWRQKCQNLDDIILDKDKIIKLNGETVALKDKQVESLNVSINRLNQSLVIEKTKNKNKRFWATVKGILIGAGAGYLTAKILK